MTKTFLPANAVMAAAIGALLMSAASAAAAAPGPAPSLVRSGSAAMPVRMMRRSTMRRPMVRRGGGRTISTKLGAKRG